jgi:hypothetical protein
VPVGPAVATTVGEEDVDGGPPGVLPTSPVAATTVVEEDVDGGPSGDVAGESSSGHHHS